MWSRQSLDWAYDMISPCVIWIGMKLRQQALGLEGNQEKLCYDLK